MNSSLSFKTLTLTFIALVAFAANSLFCRLALVADQDQQAAIDPMSFTIIRLVSGALVLWLLLQWRNRRQQQTSPPIQWRSMFSALSLFIYALCFSFAYVQLETGTGALILFGAVQITMVIGAVVAGHHLIFKELIGLLLAFGGLIYLMLPSLGTPSVLGFVLMAVAGIAWGFYSIFGAQSKDGLADTTHNFVKTLPWVAVLAMVFWFGQADTISLTTTGLIYGLLSGVFASGMGYAIWYAALNHLTAIQAAVFMLLVPLIAAAAGMLFVGEAISLRFVIAAGATLGGVLLVILNKRRTT